MTETPDSTIVSTRLERIAQLARQMPECALNTLAHHIDIVWLREAFRRTRRDGATGIDGQTAKEFEANLEENLASLLERAKSGSYRAPPVRRAYIPKNDGTERPLGIPTFEDKVLQRAVVMVLQAVYEQDFLDCSHGFRPSRSAHDALDDLRDQAMKMSGGWVVDADLKKFFDVVDHEHVMDIVRLRIRDGVILRLIAKWLHAGVMEQGNVSYPEAGTPQGGVISPMLANIFLHHVLDAWFEREVRPRLRARAFMVRYADDFVMVFEREDDARKVLDVLPKRLGKYGQSLHPDKTRLVRFVRPDAASKSDDDDESNGPGSFNLLGFTHYWGRSREGWWVVKTKTAKDRFRRALKRISEWCRANRHKPLRDQHAMLTLKLRGHYNYYSLPGNLQRVRCFAYKASRVWFKWLKTRSQRAHASWDWFDNLMKRLPLPRPRIQTRHA